jgi:ABC-type multidrug transport system fused ATPase/permease subunit
MEKKIRNLIFLLLSIFVFILSFIDIFISPIISGRLSNGRKYWNSINCQKYSDECDDERTKIRNEHLIDKYQIKERLKYCLKNRNRCQRKKAMYGLEYASIISDLCFGIIIIFLSILNYKTENYNRYIGLIVIIVGAISSILTFFYVIYNTYIFNNDIAFFEDNSDNLVHKTHEDGSFAYWDPNNSRYICYYYYGLDNLNYINDIDSFDYIKYKDLGKKQYNKLFKMYINSLVQKCTVYERQNLITICLYGENEYLRGQNCEILYYFPHTDLKYNTNKKLYDIWLMSIIFSYLIIGTYIAIITFGIIIFLDTDDNNYQVIER